jgi:hypothetical protein
MFSLLRPVFALLTRFGPWVMLAATLFLIGVVLTLLGAVFGFSLADVDVWLEAHGGFFNAAGKLLLRTFFGLILLLCVYVILSPILFRKEKDGAGLGCILLAIPVGYFCWIGTFGDY